MTTETFTLSSKKLHTIPNFFVAHLAAVDSVICGVVLPLKLHSMITGKHNVGCQFFGPIVIAMMVLSLLSLANIALNRYILVCRNPQVTIALSPL